MDGKQASASYGLLISLLDAIDIFEIQKYI
jgi:hypothetical protein